MNTSPQPLLVAIAGASLLTIGGMVWIGHDLLLGDGKGGTGFSLHELLDSGPRSQPPRPPSRPAPPPPQPQTWRSPLASSCPALDLALQQRLALTQGRLQTGLRQRVTIDPTNYGERYRSDAFGNPVRPEPQVIVLHETVYDLESAVNTFKTPHPRDEDQVSYHTLVGLDGQVVDTVDPAKRAFGAGNSAFNGRWVITNPKVGGSINNFALHLSLETPEDGVNEGAEHSGYTEAQYDAAALVIADWMRRYRIPADGITTHRHVDLGGERSDPRSFQWSELQRRLRALGMGC